MRIRTTGESLNAMSWLPLLVVAAVLVSVWHLLTTRNYWDPTIVPPPAKVLAAAWQYRSVLTLDTVVTLGEVVLGFIMTVAAALASAIVLHLLPRVSKGVYGILIVVQSVPLWAIAPVLFYWTGPGLLTRLIVIVLVAFFPVLVNTMAGLRNIDRDLRDLFDSMNATRWQKLRMLEVPSAIRVMLAGFKITLTMCVIGAVLAEMLIGDMVGLGYRVRAANAHFRVDLVFASVAIMALIVVGLFALLTLLANKYQPWLAHHERTSS